MAEAMRMYVALDEAGFRALVKGEVVRLRAADGRVVELIFQDIGFDRMLAAVNEAIADAPVWRRWEGRDV